MTNLKVNSGSLYNKYGVILLKSIEEQLDTYGQCLMCNEYGFLDTNRSSPSIEKFCSSQCYLEYEYTPHPMFTEKDWWNYGPGIVSGKGALIAAQKKIIDTLKIFADPFGFKND